MTPPLPPRGIRALGDEALLIECRDPDDVDAVAAWVAAEAAGRGGPDATGPASLEIVPGAATVMVRGLPLQRLRAVAAALPDQLPAVGPRDGGEVRIPVLYKGDDLAATAEAAGMGVERFVALHTAARWRVLFTGFAPGFGYLRSDDWTLRIPRRELPRASVPPGSVALADDYSGVYPRSSPGGWQLIGSTEAALWDVDRVPPALLRPGTVVRFEELP